MKPILFNTDMVRAIQKGTKTVTRRVVGIQNVTMFKTVDRMCVTNLVAHFSWSWAEDFAGFEVKKPYRPGDILYVRETWAPFYETMYSDPVIGYRYFSETDEEIKERLPEYLNWYWPGKWSPSIHMPREAARIFLRVTGVRVERLQDIKELDILEKEGVTVDFPQPKPSYMSLAYTETRLKPAVRKAFADLWDRTINPAGRAIYGWEANPWVWVIEFERCEKPGGD